MLPPATDVIIAGNHVYNNSSTTAPVLATQDIARGNGIILAGVRDAVVVNNRIENHSAAGIAIAPFPDENVWFSGGNEVRGNIIDGSGLGDVMLTGPGLGGDCFAGNDMGRTIPAALELAQPCDGEIRLPWGSNTSGLFFLLGRFAATNQIDTFPVNDWRTQPVPPAQDPMDVDAPVVPAVDVFADAVRDPASLTAPAGGALISQTQELTLSGMPLAAGFWPGLFSLYGYYLPFILLAAWVTLSLWDIVRREDLEGAGALAWMAVVLVVPFLGALAYLFVGGSEIPLGQRLMIVVGGFLAFVLVVGGAAVAGGIV